MKNVSEQKRSLNQKLVLSFFVARKRKTDTTANTQQYVPISFYLSIELCCSGFWLIKEKYNLLENYFFVRMLIRKILFSLNFKLQNFCQLSHRAFLYIKTFSLHHCKMLFKKPCCDATLKSPISIRVYGKLF